MEEILVTLASLIAATFGVTGAVAFYQVSRYFGRRNREEAQRLRASSSEQTVTRSELETMIRRAVAEGAPVESPEVPRRSLSAREGV